MKHLKVILIIVFCVGIVFVFFRPKRDNDTTQDSQESSSRELTFKYDLTSMKEDITIQEDPIISYENSEQPKLENEQELKNLSESFFKFYMKKDLSENFLNDVKPLLSERFYSELEQANSRMTLAVASIEVESVNFSNLTYSNEKYIVSIFGKIIYRDSQGEESSDNYQYTITIIDDDGLKVDGVN